MEPTLWVWSNSGAMSTSGALGFAEKNGRLVIQEFGNINN